MQSKAKSNSICTAILNRADATLTVTVLGAGSATFYRDKASAENRIEAEWRGWSQRLTNQAALPHDKATGKPATPEEKFAAVKRAVDHYNAGGTVWAIAADDTYDTGLVVQAMIRAKVATDAEVANEIANKLAAKRGIDRAAALKIWATVGPVGEAIATIKAERAAEIAKHANLDVQGLLDEINAEAEDKMTETPPTPPVETPPAPAPAPEPPVDTKAKRK